MTDAQTFERIAFKPRHVRNGMMPSADGASGNTSSRARARPSEVIENGNDRPDVEEPEGLLRMLGIMGVQ
jgi:hypothetical protein